MLQMDKCSSLNRKNGVAAKIQEENPAALFVHCFAHCTNDAFDFKTGASLSLFGFLQKRHHFLK